MTLYIRSVLSFFLLLTLSGFSPVRSSRTAVLLRSYSSSSLSSLAATQNLQNEAVGYRVLSKAPTKILSRGEQALLVSRKYGEIGGNQHLLQDPLDLLKERLLARLQGNVLVATTITFRSRSTDLLKAREVVVVGSWAQWVLLHAMTPSEPDAWEVTLNLPPGEHQFKFLVDGQWLRSADYDTVDDSVGSDGNNVLQVCTAAEICCVAGR